jgi:uncharacterized protein YjbI with pentapeptide repeats
MMAWLTLAIAPVLVLLVFQFKFLPYHSHVITWTVRGLITLDLVTVLIMWEGVFRQDYDLTWRLPVRSWIAWSCALVLAVFSWAVLTFPGEPHAEWTRYWPVKKKHLATVDCRTMGLIANAFPHFDRLYLWEVDVIDDEKLAKIEKTAAGREFPHRGKPTRSFRGRDLNCSVLTKADLRRVDLTDALLMGADLFWADLKGANLTNAHLQNAYLFEADLQEAELYRADLRSAVLEYAKLQHANLGEAQLQGALLSYAELQDTNLYGAHLQGAILSRARLQAAYLEKAQLQGASLNDARLQVANLDGAQLQGAILHGADLGAASFERAGLQGADLNGSVMQHTKLSATYVWRANVTACNDARVSGQLSDALIPTIVDDDVARELVRETVLATSEIIEKFIQESVAGILDPEVKNAAIGRMRTGLIVDPANDNTAAIEKVWRNCEQISHQLAQADFDKRAGAFLRVLFCNSKYLVCANGRVCDEKRGANAVAHGILRNWFLHVENRLEFLAQLARGMLGEDGKRCIASKELNTEYKDRLSEFATAAPSSAPAPQLSAE